MPYLCTYILFIYLLSKHIYVKLFMHALLFKINWVTDENCVLTYKQLPEMPPPLVEDASQSQFQLEFI